MKSTRDSFLVTLVFLAGLLSVFVGERVLGAGAGRTGLSGLGVALVLGALVWRGVRLSSASADRKVLERWLLALGALGAAGLAVYFLQSDAATRLWGAAFDQKFPRAAVVLAALFPAMLAASVLPTLLVESAAHAMARAPVLETARAKEALFSGLALAFVLVFAFSAMYVATEADHVWDWSYFRTAKPGESTRRLVRGLTEPVQVTLFFPPANEVGEAVQQYFRDLSAEAPQLQVEVLDQAVEPVRARDLRVTSNGAVVIGREARRETLTLGLEVDRARGQLQRLDQEVQKRLLTVSKAKQNFYFTTGHGERGDVQGPLEVAGPGVTQLKELLRQQNVEVRSLSAAEGLANEVPGDAAVVAIIGPSRPFLPEEIAALRAFQERGGALWIALEPQGPDLSALLAPLGVKQLPGALANDEVFFRATRQVSDRANLAATAFSSHPAVSTLSSAGGQLPVAFLGAVPLEALQPPPQGLSQDSTVRAHPVTFQDLDGDFNAAPAEKRNPWPLAFAIERKEGQGSRSVVLSDADALGDLAMGNLGNAYLALDALRWLTREEAISGQVSNEEDVPIQHTRREDSAWFYASVFLAPALVLALGFIVTRRRRSGRAARPLTAVEGSTR